MKSKTVLITGASHGIGSSIAKTFARSGYNVLINYFRSENEALHLVNELKLSNASVAAFQADVADCKAVEKMFDFCIQTFGGLDVLINNAAIAQSKLFTDITQEDWQNMLSVNLTGVFHCSQEALKWMLPEKQGKIINLSSIWGMTGASMEVHYATTKAAIIGLTKSLAKEVGPSGITVNAIAPGVIMTRMLDDLSTEDVEALKDQTPLGILGKPEDIAKLALFLASDDANFITGQVISPNGGFVI